MTYYIKADRFLFAQEEKKSGYLQVEKDRFGPFTSNIPANVKVEDWTGYTIAPGLFDTHIHGVNGQDVMDGTKEAIQVISSSILKLGVTRFLPTTLTSSQTNLEQAIIAVREAVNSGLPGALSEGIFLEGPYFTDVYKGAQQADYFRDPSEAEFLHWQTLAHNQIVKIALAPERDGATRFIRSISEKGIVASIGHSDASYDCCHTSVDAGARVFIHLFNGMSGLHHRDPGVVGAALNNDTTFAELICDGYHMHPDVANLTLRIKGDKLVLITDCMRAGLMANGNYLLGELPVVMHDGVARTKAGNLAGSTLKLIDGVKHLQQWSGQPLHKIWHLASLSPAASMHRDKELGSLDTGKLADYVVLDQALNIQATAVEGEVKYIK